VCKYSFYFLFFISIIVMPNKKRKFQRLRRLHRCGLRKNTKTRQKLHKLQKKYRKLKIKEQTLRKLNDAINYKAKAPGMNLLFFSSMLFVIPAVIGFVLLPRIDLTLACLGCLFTSILNHYHKSQNKIYHLVDVYFVNFCVLIFLVHSFLKIKTNIYTTLMYISAAITGGIYFYLKTLPIDIHDSYHWLVHIFANIGVVFYVLGRKHRLAY
jgi:hypothetical protein